MPHVSFNAAETPDELPLPPIGEPVTVELTDAQDKESKAGNQMIELVFKVVAVGELYDGFPQWEYLVEPGSSKRTQIAAKRVGKAFGLGDAQMATGVEFTDLIGKSCQVRLKKDTRKDNTETRRIAEFIVA